jgi:hypothetical protein
VDGKGWWRVEGERERERGGGEERIEGGVSE